MPGRVYIQGDSLTVDATDYLRSFARPSLLSISAKIGRHTSTGVAAIVAARAWLPSAVVVALGTNDDTDSWGVIAFRSHVNRALSILGPSRCIIWVDMFQMPKKGFKGLPIFAPLNRVLEDAAKTHRNLKILHWSMLSSRNTAWYHYDSIHPTDAGYVTRAKEIVHALSGCPRQTRSAPTGTPSGGQSGGVAPL
jgi:lysophospholipase L1-like esterase